MWNRFGFVFLIPETHPMFLFSYLLHVPVLLFLMSCILHRQLQKQLQLPILASQSDELHELPQSIFKKKKKTHNPRVE